MTEQSPELDQECGSCGEGLPDDECKASGRPCGHHCNHSWESDECCWCRVQFAGDGVEIKPALTEAPNPSAAVPTGMCGSRKKCAGCPSDFLCSTKARAERDLIAARVTPPGVNRAE